MDQLKKSDGNGYQIKNDISYFDPLYGSDNEEGTKHRTKLKTPIILQSE